MNSAKFLFFVILAAIFAFLQFMAPALLGAKPNFALIFFASIAVFVPEIWEGIFLVTLHSFFLKFSPHADKEILALLAIGIAIFLIRKFLNLSPFLRFLAIILLATIAFYAVLFASSIISLVFLMEVLYNVIIGSVIFFVLSRFKFIISR